ncbi:MAG TPA: hypothetical protein DEB39_01185 [Planctomycetaceae bacterium]|nr:hypothetical protein [Planctomycetaceae bacterium]
MSMSRIGTETVSNGMFWKNEKPGIGDVSVGMTGVASVFPVAARRFVPGFHTLRFRLLFRVFFMRLPYEIIA